MSDEEWKEDEVLTLSQKIKKLFSPDKVKKVKKTLSPPPLKQTSTKKIRRLKKNRHKKDSDVDDVNVIPPNIQPNTVNVEDKLTISESSILQSLSPTLEIKEKDDRWIDEDKPKNKKYIPQIDRQLPLPLVIKRIMASIIVLTIISGIIFVIREPIPILLLLIIGFLLLDYLSITGPQKEEKWND